MHNLDLNLNDENRNLNIFFIQYLKIDSFYKESIWKQNNYIVCFIYLIKYYLNLRLNKFTYNRILYKNIYNIFYFYF